MIDNFISSGGPAEPNVSYMVNLTQGVVQLSWPRPSNWEHYNITGYHTLCKDSDNMILYNEGNNTVIEVVNVTVYLPRIISECYIIHCNVSVSNERDTTTAITNKSITHSKYYVYTTEFSLGIYLV